MENSTNTTGTLLWIGTRTDPQIVEAYHYCEAMTRQIAYRSSILDAIARPADLVETVLVPRMARVTIDPCQMDRLRQLYPNARFVCLLGSGCEGEQRTGTPWSGWLRIYWHQWFQKLPPLLFPNDSLQDTPDSISIDPMVLVIATTRLQAEPLLDIFGQESVSAVWAKPECLSGVRRPTHVVWDDSAACPVSCALWQERLRSCDQATPSDTVQHGWHVGFPRVHQWQDAQRAGVHCLLSKPCEASAILHFVGL